MSADLGHVHKAVGAFCETSASTSDAKTKVQAKVSSFAESHAVNLGTLFHQRCGSKKINFEA